MAFSKEQEDAMKMATAKAKSDKIKFSDDPASPEAQKWNKYVASVVVSSGMKKGDVEKELKKRIK